eukprot:1354444-Amorphochlora_amoeboformis.AAC.3
MSQVSSRDSESTAMDALAGYGTDEEDDAVAEEIEGKKEVKKAKKKKKKKKKVGFRLKKKSEPGITLPSASDMIESSTLEVSVLQQHVEE